MATVQEFTVTVVDEYSDASSSQPPQFTSTPTGPLTPGVPWTYQLVAEDPDTPDTQLVFALTEAPDNASFDSTSRTVSWTPAAGDIGTQHRFTVTVTDGTHTTKQTSLVAVGWNLAPKFLSSPPDELRIGGHLEYDVIAVDPNGDDLTLTLDDAALDLGFALDGNVLTFTPTRLGLVEATITASDGHLETNQHIQLQVVSANTPPEFVSEPPIYTPAGVEWWYVLSARDADGHEVYYSIESDSVSLVHHPDDPGGIPNVLYIDIPQINDDDLPITFPVTATVTDTLGATDTQSFEIIVEPSGQRSKPPTITSRPEGPAYLGEEWVYEIKATADEPLFYNVISAPGDTSGMKLAADGRVTWTPTQPGNYWVQIWVGAGNNGVSHGFLLPAETKNSPPKIYSVPYDPIYVGAEWRYEIMADDPDGDLLTFELQSDTAGFALNDDNVLTFTPTADDVGQNQFVLTVRDGNGGEWIEEVDIEVRSPEDAEQFESGQPVILSVPSNAAVLGEEWQFPLVVLDPNPEEGPDGTPLETEFRFYVAPGNEVAGLTVHPQTGFVTFTPTERQVGHKYTGAVMVEERINGQAGDQTIFRFPLRVLRVNQAPEIQSTPQNQAYVDSSRTWHYPLTVVDAESDDLIYELDAAAIEAGFQIIDDTDRQDEGQKKIIWQPDDRFSRTDSKRMLGQSVHLTVYDRVYTEAYRPIELSKDFSVIGITRQAFTVTIGDNNLPAASGAPAIISLPEIAAELDMKYEYQVEVGPGENDFTPQVTYYIVEGPEGSDSGVARDLTIDSKTGLIEWVASSVGNHEIGIEIRSLEGQILDQQWFLLSAVEPEGANEAPVITTPSLPTGYRNVDYEHQIEVFDANGHDVRFSLEDAPEGLNIHPATGLLSWSNPDWTPLTGDAKTYEFTVVVREPDTFDKLETKKAFKLTFDQNAPPVFTSVAPNQIDWRATPFEHTLSGFDYNGDSISFTVPTEALPDGMSFDGQNTLTWNLTNDSLGRHSFQATVTDEHGAQTVQSIEVQVIDSQTNHPPVILNEIRSTVPAGFDFAHYVIATDQEQDTLVFGLEPFDASTPVPDGIQINPDTGILTWTPTQAQVGSHQFNIVINEQLIDGDVRTAQSTTQPVTILVTADLQNTAPAISNQPKRSATWDYEYVFTPEIEGDTDGPPLMDPDNDPIFWTLLESPTGMQVDPLTGLVFWTPDSEVAAGFYDVSLRAADPYGGSDTLKWTIQVRQQNLAPLLTVPSIVNVPLNDPTFQWSATAYDIDENDLTFSRTDGTTGGLQIAADGSLTWNPQTLATLDAVIQVDDGRGGTDSRIITFRPYNSTVNSPPTVSGLGDSLMVAPIGDSAIRDFMVGDIAPDATSAVDLTLQLTSIHTGLSVTHVPGAPGNAALSWANPDVAPGYHLVELTITDDHSSALTTHIVQVVHVRENALPVLEDLEDVTLVAGNSHHQQAVATDADRDVLTWDISVQDDQGANLAADWYTIDRNGFFTLATPTSLNHGNYTVEIGVSDISATGVTKTFVLTVDNDVDAPVASVSLSKDPVSLGEEFIISVSATDNVGVISLTAGYREVGTTTILPLTLDQFGKTPLTLNEKGHYEVFVTAIDAAGNQSDAAAVHDFKVVDRPPVIEIISPPPGGTIKEPTDIVATINDAESAAADVHWTVRLQKEGSSNVYILADSSGEPREQAIAQIDTTLLENGQYVLTVEATDGDGNTTSVSNEIQVDGRLKLGNFNLNFTDLEIATPGIPITVSRTYDTLMADRALDFGYGWQLDLGRPELEVFYPSNRLTAFEGNYVPFRDGTRIAVRLPDGTTDWFTFKTSLKINNGYGVPWGERGYVPYFVPDKTARTKLYLAEDIILTKSGDEYLWHQRGFNPTAQLSKVDFRLVMYNESVIGIDPVNGDSYIEDRNENRLTIRDSGSLTTMTHSDGKQVKIYRDPKHDNRIQRIVDPAGFEITYHYNAAGELVEVIDRVENQKLSLESTYDPASVRLEYWDNSEYSHYLNRIFDQANREITEVVYDQEQDGRVVRLKDASNAAIDLAHSVGEKSQSSEDSSGRELQALRDAEGNVIRSQQVVRDETNGNVIDFEDIVIRDYDVRGNVIFEQTVVGDIDTGQQGGPPDLIQEFGYDSNGALTHATDVRGNRTFHSYDKYGSLTSTTDTLGNTVDNFYDDDGNLTRTTDGQRTTEVKYDARGQVLQVFDLENPDVALVSNEYLGSGPHRGMVESSTDQFGNTTTFGYDANGNQNLVTRIVAAGTNDEVRTEDHSVYDPNGRIIATTRYEFARDENGVEYLRHSTTSSTSYNLLGQVKYTVDSNGLRSESVYDERGLVIQTRSEVRGSEFDETSNSYQQVTQWLISRTVYDALGRAIVTTDSFREDSTEPVSGRHTVYNEKGLVEQTYQLDNLNIHILDASGTVYSSDAQFTEFMALHTDWNGLHDEINNPDGATVLASTTTGYDDQERVVWTEDRYGRRTETSYNAFGDVVETRRRSQDYDPQSNTYSDVWIVSRTVYDEHGRSVATTDSFLMSQDQQTILTENIRGTRTVYDSRGRVELTMRVNDLDIWMDPVTGNSRIKSFGTEISRSSTIYNAKGQTAATIQVVKGADGQPDQTTRTDYEYDELGRTVATTGPEIPVGGLELTPPANAESVRLRSETIYNDDGQVYQQLTNIHHFVISGTADPVIDRSQVQTTELEYDSEGRIQRRIFDDGTFTITTYDDEGRVATETNQVGETRSYTYDDFGRQTSVTLPGVADPQNNDTVTNPVYHYRYDGFGNLIEITDPLGRDTFFTFTEDNQQQSRTLPLGLGADGMKGTADDGLLPDGDFTEQFEYDERGRQQRHTSFEGIITEFIYDDDPTLSDSIPHFGRLYQKRFYADQAAFDAGTVSETITMTHDAFGRELTTVWDRVATTPGLVVDTWANTLDEHGRLNQVDSPTGQIFYEYDSQGRQVRVATRPAGFTPQNDDDVSTDIRYTYDLLGRLASVETWERNDVLVDTDPVTAGQQPETNSYVYDLVGNLDRELNPDGSTTDYTFDDLNRLTDITTTRSDGTLLTDFDYTLRADGKRDLAVEKIYSDDGSLASHTTFDWEYDAAGRLTDEIFTNADGLLFDLDDYHTAFEYDLTGNRISKSTITDDDGTPGFDAATDTDEVITYGQGANDRMTSEDRAVDGVAVDSTSYGHTGTQQTSKTVTAAGSLHSVSSVVYSYDLQGRMSQAVTTTTDPNTGVATRIDTTSYRYG